MNANILLTDKIQVDLCERCCQRAKCRKLSKSVKQIIYCFTYFDNVDRKRYKSNYGCIYSARYYRNIVLSNKERYSSVSDIFEDKCDI